MGLMLPVILLLALGYMVGPCNCTGLCSPETHEFRLSKDGAFHLPVFHRKHPCLGLDDPAPIHAASVSDAGTVIGNDEIHGGKYFMAISLGTPAVFNLVIIDDTGSTLSWVNCERCQIKCHNQSAEAGLKFDPHGSATYRHVGCSDEHYTDIQADNGVPYGCIEETDTCIYRLSYGSSQYSVGKLGRDRLALGYNHTIVDDFIFGCSVDDIFLGKEAGIIGFGDQSYSFNQMVRQMSYIAFAYCFPSDHREEGFLIVGPYPKKLELVTPLIRGYGPRSFVYSLLLLDMMVDGRRLEVDRSVNKQQDMVVDFGTDDTFVSSPVFYAFAEEMASSMQGKGYYIEYSLKVCFRPAGGEPMNWMGLPTVEMQFPRATLKLPPENVFHQQSADRICLAFQPDSAGVAGIWILGNKALISFRVVHDLQKMTFGFQARAC